MSNSVSFGGRVCCVGVLLGLGVLVSAAAPRTRAPRRPAAKAASPLRPMIIAHRGASGTLPEHTMAAYQLAIRQGADAIEPDLVSTKDGVLVVRHENELSGTTDVAKKFPKRKRTKSIDGRRVEGWFSEDLTLAEWKTLRAKERLPFRNQANNGKFPLVTFREVLALVARHNKGRKRKLWIVPELKHPTHFQKLGLAMEPKLLKALRAFQMDRADAPVVVQSFEESNLKWLHKRSKVRLLQLLGAPTMHPYDRVIMADPRTYGDMMTDKGLKAIAKYAYAIGPWKGLIWMPPKYRKMLKASPGLVKRAHKYGLKVFAYTFRDEKRYLAKRFKGSPQREYHFFFGLGIDALFSDFPATAVAARRAYHRPAPPSRRK